MFKKIICLIMVVFTLLSSFVLSSSAATDDSDVLEDLSTSSVNGIPFSEANYPINYNDRNLYVIATVEQGFNSVSGSPNFAFYVYVYNPSCVEVTDRAVNSMQAGYNEEHRNEQFSYYGLKLLGKTDDYRFLKFKVVDIASYRSIKYLYFWQENATTRVYDIASIRLVVNGVLTTFPVNKAFFFSGFDYDKSLTCYSEELGAIDVEMYPTNWISPNAGYKTDGVTEAGIYDHYEINSVYFTMPRSLFEGPDAYDDIQYIGAAFDWYRLTPIIVTAPTCFDSDKGEVTKNAILKGTKIPQDGEIDVFEISAAKEDWLWGKYIEPSWVYSENGNFIDRWKEKGAGYYDCLAYYFENSALEGYDFLKAKSGEVVGFTSEQLEAYFDERNNNPNYDKSKLYTDHEYKEIDLWARNYNKDSFYNMQEYTSVAHDIPWYKKIGKSDDSYLFEKFASKEADHLQVIQDPSAYVSVTDPKAVANELFISQYDVDHFSKLCQKAVDNNEVVVLLRFGFSDYTCAPIVDCWEAFDIFNTYIGVAIEKTAYFDVNLLHVAFSKNKQTIVVPVVSNTVDSAGDGVIMGGTNGDPGDFSSGYPKDDDDDWFKKIVMIIGIVLLIVALVFLVRIALEKNGKEETFNYFYGPPPEEKKQKKKRLRR